MVAKLKVLLAALAIAISIGAWPSGSTYPPFLGPCDQAGVVCAEAWSVTRAMKASYNGPLFQLNNGSSTLDIGQVNHKANMTTWSAFCSGVAANCTISKVYAQINTTSNDLTPFNTGAGGPSVFTIEAATGLPLWVSNHTGVSQNSGGVYAIGGSSDNASTGINAGGASETVIMNVLPVQQPNGFCCGMFGTAHLYSCCATTGGTDFLVAAAYGQVPSGDGAQCSTVQTYCIGLDEECCYTQTTIAGDQLDYSAVPFGGAVVTYAFDSVANKLSAYVNGVQLFNKTPSCNSTTTPACTMDSGTRVHYGGGGDLTGPELVESREMLITNSALSQAQVTAVTNNMKAFYSAVNFPSGPNNPVTYAAGPLDVVPSATYYNGLRAASAAIAAAGTQQIISVENFTSGDGCGVLVNAAGGLGNTTGCTHSGENGQPVLSFCTTPQASNSGPGMDCKMIVVYDQVANVANYVNIGAANTVFVPYCINFTPCALFTGGQLGASITLSAVPQPYTAVALGWMNVGSTAGTVLTQETGNNSPGFYFGHGGSANQLSIATNTGGTFPGFSVTGVADGVLHSMGAIFNGASSSANIDGTITTGTVGSDAAGPNGTIRIGNTVNAGANILHGFIAETGLYPFGLTPTQQANLRANQRAYWGF